MPASSARFEVMLLRPWMPAENEPAEPNALTQSSQLTCSLIPSSTVPSTRLVIIWLKRCFATSLIEPALESEPVGQGGNAATATAGPSWTAGPLRYEYELLVDIDVDVEVEVDVEHDVGAVCANATPDSPRRKNSEAAAINVAKTIQLREKFAMVSARTACRWDRCRHRRPERPSGYRHIRWCCIAPPPRRRSLQMSRVDCWSSGS